MLVTDAAQIYDPATNQWQSSLTAGNAIQPLPAARGGMGKAVYFNGEFYVMGGETTSSANPTVGITSSASSLYCGVSHFHDLPHYLEKHMKHFMHTVLDKLPRASVGKPLRHV